MHGWRKLGVIREDNNNTSADLHARILMLATLLQDQVVLKHTSVKCMHTQTSQLDSNVYQQHNAHLGSEQKVLCSAEARHCIYNEIEHFALIDRIHSLQVQGGNKAAHGLCSTLQHQVHTHGGPLSKCHVTRPHLVDLIHCSKGAVCEVLQCKQVQHGGHTTLPATLTGGRQQLKAFRITKLHHYLNTILAEVLKQIKGKDTAALTHQHVLGGTACYWSHAVCTPHCVMLVQPDLTCTPHLAEVAAKLLIH